MNFIIFLPYNKIMKAKFLVISILAVVALICLCGLAIFLYNYLAYPVKYEKEIGDVAGELGADKTVVASIINVESRFNPNAVSNKGAVGLMQIMPETAAYVAEKLSREKNVSDEFKAIFISNKDIDLLDPNVNIKIGTYYFLYLLKKFENFDVAICAYNAGEGNVRKWLSDERYSNDGKVLKKIPYQETRNYLNKIKLNLKVYASKF